MALATIILVLLYFVLALIFFFRPLVLVLESLIALIIGFAVSIIFFNQTLGFSKAMGITESVYSPALIFIVLVIFIWAFVFTLLSALIKFGHLVKSYKTHYLAFIVSIFFTGFIGIIGCLCLTPFLQNTTAREDVDRCFLCRLVKTSPMRERLASDGLVQVDPDIFLPENNQRAIILADEFTVSTHNAAKSEEALNLINGDRAKSNIAALSWDEQLSELASRYGLEMSSTKYFAHTNQDGQDGKERAEQMGLKYNYLGENLAIGPDLEQAHQALVRSESHNKNITSVVFTKVGVVVFDLENGYVMLVQEFAG